MSYNIQTGSGIMDHKKECGGSVSGGHDRPQRHVHEMLGSVRIALDGCEPHNHRFATVCGEAIPVGQNDHVHEVCFCTNFYEDHYHEFTGRTGGMIDVGCGRHVHFLHAQTKPEDRHVHCFRVATLINDPIGD